MITNGRYFLRAHSATELWRYDRKWRRTKYFEPRAGEPFECTEGAGVVLVQSGNSDQLHLSVHGIEDPGHPLAEGYFVDSVWTFAGAKEPWTLVSEHVLVPLGERRGLLRIADGAVVDPLDDLPVPTTVIGVPESRLVVLAGSGAITVYDPKGQHAGVRLQLSQHNPRPTLRFRNKDSELWVDDADSLIKLETRNWTVTDAAGSQVGEDDEKAPLIKSWDFSPDASRVLIVREGTNDVVIATAETLDPIATFVLTRPAVDVAESADGRLIAVDANGGLPRSKRIKTAPEEA